MVIDTKEEVIIKDAFTDQLNLLTVIRLKR